MNDPIEKIDSDFIAQKAGVSRCTVSKVLNGYSDVGEKTRQKVLSLVEEYGYSPNLAGRLLAGKSVETIGLFFILRQDAPYSFADDPIVDMMLGNVAEAASENGYLTLTVIIRDMDTESQNRIRTIFTQKRIDGGIFIGACTNEPIIEELVGKGYTLGILDYPRPLQHEPNRLIVNYDPNVGEKAVDHLVSRGYSRIFSLQGEQKRFDGQCKYYSFCRGMAKHGLDIPDGWTLFTSFNVYGAYTAAYNFLSSTGKLPEAVFCANDHIAYGFLNATRKLGIRVPEDIAVIGSDDAMPSRYGSPSVTSFRVEFRLMLRTLTRGLIEYISNPADSPLFAEFESVLVDRESC
ncbi:MAG: LacI family DNA-binding transcriptional regulator [Spirochaetota bacterium]